ncbi:MULTISPECIES: hypothetical protein [Sphingobium]|uniref:Uncharacterized protein n=1 Tax=Sphingobium lactosutens DS20 TaxID=1331060 RepID=T0HFZ5_9SPHN|nr:hypothetical protein [Sphingobium lactosutens]EQB11937.1 hypothetical protein RLDS_22690 [Sphingobium lactosutens DS20]MEA3542634.1 hypothetical protein [Pseudomonadota bacterium]
MLTKADLLAQNRAIYLPAISANYANFARNGAFKRKVGGLIPADLDFLDPSNRYFAYPFALYSAGQVIRTPNKLPKACMVAQRDRNETIVLGDSGGFQVSRGTIEFEKDTTARRMLKWMEGVADWSMVMDFPTGGIGPGFMKPHVERLIAEGHDLSAMCKANGQSLDFNACLLQTQINNDQFVAERTAGATGLLNVLQGRNEAESKAWYEAVKHYPFEGIAFAGAHQNHFSLLLRRLYDLHIDGQLQKCAWVHVLGVSTLDIGCLLTKVQRCVREHWGYPDFQISFDSASPFINAANNGMIIGQTLDAYGWTIRTAGIATVGSNDLPLSVSDFCTSKLHRKTDRLGREMIAARTATGNRIGMADLCVGKAKIAGQRDRSGLDVDGSYLLMYHNVQAFVTAHAKAHEVFFGPEQWRIPLDTLSIAGAIDVMFRGEPITSAMGGVVYAPVRDPISHIKRCQIWLDRLAIQRTRPTSRIGYNIGQAA